MFRILVFLSMAALSIGHTLPEPKDDVGHSVEIPHDNAESEFPEDEIRRNWGEEEHKEDNDLYKDYDLYDLVYPDEHDVEPVQKANATRNRYNVRPRYGNYIAPRIVYYNGRPRYGLNNLGMRYG